jgi:hypothetical protein
MIDGIEAYYQRIADSMTEALPKGWAVAHFEVIFFPDHSVYEAEYLRKDGLARSFEPSEDGPRAFRELRALFKNAGRLLWGRAIFELRTDGTFDMKWGYEDCDADGNCRFDVDEEVRRREERFHRLTKR